MTDRVVRRRPVSDLSLFDAMDADIRRYFEEKNSPRRRAQYATLLQEALEEYNLHPFTVIVGRDGKRRSPAYDPLASRRGRPSRMECAA